ncbi:MAG: (d)CMP kinase [Promethearchaeota archaeon]
MIITISGLHGTGKSTISKLIAEKLGLQYYSTGQAFRELAKEMGLTLEEFSKYAEKNPEIDKKLDNKIFDIAEKGNCVIDSQLSGHLLKFKADLKILLTCPIETRVKRMAERDKFNFDKKLEETKIREKSELNRFKKLYNIDLSDQNKIKELYDLVIETENLTIQEITNEILNKIRTNFP